MHSDRNFAPSTYATIREGRAQSCLVDAETVLANSLNVSSLACASSTCGSGCLQNRRSRPMPKKIGHFSYNLLFRLGLNGPEKSGARLRCPASSIDFLNPSPATDAIAVGTGMRAKPLSVLQRYIEGRFRTDLRGCSRRAGGQSEIPPAVCLLPPVPPSTVVCPGGKTPSFFAPRRNWQRWVFGLVLYAKRFASGGQSRECRRGPLATAQEHQRMDEASAASFEFCGTAQRLVKKRCLTNRVTSTLGEE